MCGDRDECAPGAHTACAHWTAAQHWLPTQCPPAVCAPCRRIELQIRQFLAVQAGVGVPPPAQPAPPLQQREQPAAAAGEQPAAAAGAEGGLTESELYRGLLAGLGKKTRKRQLKRWVQQGKQLPPELAAEAPGGGANSAGAEAAEGGANGEGASDAEEEREAEEEEEDSQERPPDAASTTPNGSSSAAGAEPANAAGVGPADLRNTGHLWHGNEVRCHGSWREGR